MRKRGLQVAFSWLFAIIVGGFILFLAVFAAYKLMSTEQGALDARTGKEIGILLNPLETGFESAKTSSITFPVNTRIFNKCNHRGNFGRHLIQVSQRSFNKWTETEIDVGFSNKYIFSGVPVEGKKFYLFSKPFEFPFKVSDVIYMTSAQEDFCFIAPPDPIEREIGNIDPGNLFVDNCTEDMTNVCFVRGEGCDVYVDYNLEFVEKEGEKVFFKGDALMYAAIFGEPNLYDCQVGRLMKKVAILAGIYKDKENFVARVGCDSNIENELLGLGTLANQVNNSGGLGPVKFLADEINEKNSANSACRLW